MKETDKAKAYNEFAENEMLNIFDENKVHIGVATREEVHRLGHWHEAFHCWFVSKEEDNDYIYLQLRSDQKKDYPNLLDITAAGHLLAHETVLDGIREIKEEIGIDVGIVELETLGIIDYCATKENFIDREIAHVFLYRFSHSMDTFKLQKEEVSGMFKAVFSDFHRLWQGELDEIMIRGFKVDDGGNRIIIERIAERNQFVPHEIVFYQHVARLIQEKMQKYY